MRGKIVVKPFQEEEMNSKQVANKNRKQLIKIVSIDRENLKNKAGRGR